MARDDRDIEFLPAARASTNARSGRAGRLLLELGVIILGVLIAFWVENYREYRGERQEERLLLEALREEFARNDSMLAVQMAVYRQRRDAQLTLVELGEAAARLPVDSATVLWAYALRGGTYDAADGVINSALGAGTLSLIRDPELRLLVASWPSQASDFQDVDGVYRQFWLRTLLPPLVNAIDPPPMTGDRAFETGALAEGDYSAVLGTEAFDRQMRWAARFHDVYEVVFPIAGGHLAQTLARLDSALAR